MFLNFCVSSNHLFLGWVERFKTRKFFITTKQLKLFM
jgi:hypothetical protein